MPAMNHSNGANKGLRGWGRIGIVFVLATTVGICIWIASAAPEAPRVTFNTVDGTPLSSERQRGRVTLVNFWSTTCSVCMEEMPRLIETYRDFHERGFDVVAVAMPYDRPDWVLDYSQRKRLPFKVAIDFDGAVNRAFGVIDATPTSFLIDARGKIVSQIVGAPDFEKLRRTIEAQLAAVR
jgi:peroxiredoxin